MKNMKKNILSLSPIIAILLTSCQMEYVELKEIETQPLNISESGIMSKEIIDESTIDFDAIFNATSESAYSDYNIDEYADANAYIEEIEGQYAATDSEAIPMDDTIVSSTSETIVEEASESNADETVVAETENSDGGMTIADLTKDADDRIYNGDVNVSIGNDWKYGRTPCEWIFVEPGKLLISNYRPNSSEKYSVKTKVSSGEKGCYIPIFIDTDKTGNDYEARFYVYEDYSKTKPDDMMFSNTLDSLTYEGKSIEEILKSKMKLSKAKNGLLVDEGVYINIVYVTDLDKILASK